ncbi:MAG: site-specific integrase, partial [Candidatus Bathyarchaeota archaeon]
QICVSAQSKAKNLTTVEPLREGLAGATKDIKGKILEYAWWLKRRGRSQITIETRVNKLKGLVNLGCDLLNPDSMKDILANQKWKQSTKASIVSIYSDFLKCFNKHWEPPIYKPIYEIPFIPTESEIDQLIAGSGKKMAALLQLLKETAIRIGEACKLRWIDIDVKQKIIRIKAEKNSKPRIFHASDILLNMLDIIPSKTTQVFPSKPRVLSTYFRVLRNRLAKRLSNPRLKEITFHTIRHWKATQLYHQTKDILFVKEFLGHKRLDSTLIYINIEKAIYYDGKPDEFHVKIARTPKEMKELLEVGFDYVCEKDGFVFFRKRK